VFYVQFSILYIRGSFEKFPESLYFWEIQNSTII